MRKRINMKRLFLVLCVVSALLGYSCSSENEYYSYEYLKNDYDQVVVVASVDVQKVSPVDSIGDKEAGYVRYLIRGDVIEPFKGDIKSGRTLEYYSVAEKGYNADNYRGKKIVFLNSLFDKKKKDWVLSEFENSARPASKEIIKRMRKIKRETEGK